MAIGNAVQRGSAVYVYNEKGRQVASIYAGTRHTDGLKDTNTTINVQRGSTIYSYDERGRQVASVNAGRQDR